MKGKRKEEEVRKENEEKEGKERKMKRVQKANIHRIWQYKFSYA